MSRTNIKKQTLRDYTRGTPSAEDTAYFNDAMNKSSDMTSAILQAIQIEQRLDESIILRLARRDQNTIDLLSKDNGALGTFFAKIGIAYALGVYDTELMEHLNIVRRIRNAFAHSRRRISFGNDLIRAELHTVKEYHGTSEEIKNRVKIVKNLTAPGLNDAIQGDGNNDMDSTLALSGRAAYTIICLHINHYLLSDQTAIMSRSVPAEG